MVSTHNLSCGSLGFETRPHHNQLQLNPKHVSPKSDITLTSTKAQYNPKPILTLTKTNPNPYLDLSQKNAPTLMPVLTLEFICNRYQTPPKKFFGGKRVPNNTKWPETCSKTLSVRHFLIEILGRKDMGACRRGYKWPSAAALPMDR